MTARPNILLLMTDEHRGDCIGADPQSPRDESGDPILHTPNLDHLASQGAMFTRAYTPAPSCIPARRCLLTGQTPFTNGCPGWGTDDWDFEHTLPGELREAGYQTKLTGKLHSFPPGNRVGFEDVEHHEALYDHPNDDYAQWLEEQTGGRTGELAHGVGRNSWDARPGHLDESLHPTTWTTNRALEFLDERDPTQPFFLTLSYVRPHPPFDPPRAYWDMYADRDLPEPYVGDWVDDAYGDKLPEYPSPDAWLADLPDRAIHRARAGYYGLITQIDHQLKRVVDRLRSLGEYENTLILLVSDHGTMLGDHHLWRKTYGYEGSARVPMLVKFPEPAASERRRRIDRPVGLEDVMPTLLSVAGRDVPDTVEGRNLLPLLDDGADSDWRTWYHGEHEAGTYDPDNGTQYLVGERTKYVWNPATGDEFLFDLRADPGETRNVVDDPDYRSEYRRARDRLIEELAGRPEEFVRDGDLSPSVAVRDDVGDLDDCR